MNTTQSSLHKILTKNIILVTVVSLGLLSLILMLDEFLTFKNNSELLRKDYIQAQQKLLKTETNNVADYIQYMLDQTEIQLKDSIQEQTENAYNIATNIYQQYKGTKSPDEIKRMIKEALRPVRFSSGRGYYFAFGIDGTIELFVDKPELEGTNMLSVQGGGGKLVVNDMIALAQQKGHGFYRYLWSKPGAEGKLHPKIVYIKVFEPFDWVLGVGEYYDNVKKEVQEKVLERIVTLRFGDEGYFFGSSYQGQPLFSNGTITKGGGSILDLTDPNGIKIIQEQQEIVKNDGEGFVNYSWHKLNSAVPSPKTSYVVGIDDWEWIIGAGVYLDSIDNIIALNRAALKADLIKKILTTAFILLLLIVFVLLWTRHISKQIRTGINLFSDFFKDAASHSTEINTSELYFVEFRHIAKFANKMLQVRKKVDEEKKELESKLAQAQKMESIGLMAGGVAHDLNNILSGITGYPQLLLMKLPEDSELRRPIEAIQDSGNRAVLIIEDLLTVARGVANIKEKRDIHSIIQEYFESPEFENLHSLYPEISFTLQLEASHSWIYCSPVHVKKCLMNLVTNAAEAIDKEGSVVISTNNQNSEKDPGPLNTVENDLEWIILRVQDSGSGIAENDLEHIFDPFYSKKVLGRSGTGLGLTIVWNTMEDHKGKVTAENTLKGTCFRLSFPVIKGHILQQEDSAPTELLSGNQEHILVVDDEPQLRDLSSQMLRTMGYIVHDVASGEEAIAFLKETPVDLLVLDMLMEPGMNGAQTYEEIIKLYPAQKAIITSGFSESGIVKKALKLGASRFIKKPYSVSHLSQVVKETLEE